MAKAVFSVLEVFARSIIFAAPIWILWTYLEMGKDYFGLYVPAKFLTPSYSEVVALITLVGCVKFFLFPASTMKIECKHSSGGSPPSCSAPVKV